MPEFLEKILSKAAAKKGLTGKAAKRYEFGAMNNIGAVKGNKITDKGREMQAKHDRKVDTVSHSYNFRRNPRMITKHS